MGMIPTIDENYVCKVYRRKPNSAFDYYETPYISFKCRPANNMEKKKYRLTQGVQASQESVFIYATNLPSDISVDDKIEFLGQIKIVQSIGYYMENDFIVNASLFSPKYIYDNSPKGITLG